MNNCIVGLQWGDEGKGKVVDVLAESSDIVVRYGGGANAGHTVVVGDEKFALHLLPSGSVRKDTICVIANGVVVDPVIITEEIESLRLKDIKLDGRLFISENAHVVLAYHKTEDSLREQAAGKDKIGTTIRGIGPCYADKVGRTFAVRMADFNDLDALKEKISKIVAYKNKLFGALYDAEPIDAEKIIEDCQLHAEKLSGFICNTTQLLHESIGAGKSVLFEGAQGALLDLDHGTFPYVTSSNASSLGMSAGCGVPSKMVDRFIGVVKAYTTRVGSGPFPSELEDEVGQYIRDKGNEYGTTTGRPRRCGWFDAVAVRYTSTIGGIDEIVMLHLDTLAGLKELKICTGYKIDGKDVSFFPSNVDALAKVECVHETLPGWDDDLTRITNFDDLPAQAQRYIKLVADTIKLPITTIGVGPKRSQTIFRK